MNENLELTIAGTCLTLSPETLIKYDQPGPRYTSYPTAPEWDDNFNAGDYRQVLKQANEKPQPTPLSLYFHLPFCESLCLYCGCNVVINKNHEVAVPYIESLKREIDLISQEVALTRPVEQLHWGGGTPTYLSPAQIEILYSHIASHFSISDNAEISIEVDPRVTTAEHFRALRRVGFNRLSLGIQDFNPLVQKTIHRIQPYEETRQLFDYARELGFESINVDLIYGLPHQTQESFTDTIDKIIEMNPDRIAVFSYAHVPWMKKQQGSFAKFLPTGFEKFRIFAEAIAKFSEAGYRYIGLDHFARPDDEISAAQDDRTLHRNFQGYTTKAGCDLYAMGVSSISGFADAYAQNWRDLPHYYDAINRHELPTMRGVRVTEEDKLRRSVINRILCHCKVVKSEVEGDFNIRFDDFFASELAELEALTVDNLVRLTADEIIIEPLGRIFLRNVAMVFDAYLQRAEASKRKVFSRTL
ncbi:MAG: oxygen-independent coproporphyrinogen III oxidase [Acidobacteriota bacterium]